MKKKIVKDYIVYIRNKEGDAILIEVQPKHKYGQAEYIGPYPVTCINNNGTLRFRKGVITDVVNIRNAVPYRE